MALDLFTVILLVILSFICGYSAGHRIGRNEVGQYFKTMIKSVIEHNQPGQGSGSYLDFLKKMKEDKGDNESK